MTSPSLESHACMVDASTQLLMTQQQQHHQHQPEDEGSASSSSSSSSSSVVVGAVHPPTSSVTTTTSWLTPGSALLLSSLPLGLGAYIGYRRTLHESSSTSAAAASSSLSTKNNNSISSTPRGFVGVNTNNFAIPTNITTTGGVPPPVLAARALIIGTLVSISGTTLLLSSIFLLSGCKSIDELISSCKIWGPTKLQNFETTLERYMGIQLGPTSGMKARQLAKIQYEQDTLGMTEEEELDYIGNKYRGELFNEETVMGEKNKPWWRK
jgi:hypothetical protein